MIFQSSGYTSQWRLIRCLNLTTHCHTWLHSITFIFLNYMISVYFTHVNVSVVSNLAAKTSFFPNSHTCHHRLCILQILKGRCQMNITLVDGRLLWELSALSLNQLQWQRDQLPHTTTIHGISCLPVHHEQKSFPRNMRSKTMMI